jgi:hypothetical protein
MALKHHIKIGEREKTKTFRKRDQFAAEITYFSDCILQNKKPEPSGLEGLADVRVVRAIYESVRTGKKVSLPALPNELGRELTKKKWPDMEQEIHLPAHGKPSTVKTKSPSGEAA